jgi:hypothetical protein
MKYFAAIAAASLACALPAAAAEPGLPVGECINMGNSFEISRTYSGPTKPIDAADFARIKAAGSSSSASK